MPLSPIWQPVISGATTVMAALRMAFMAFIGGCTIAGVGDRYFFLIGAALTLVGALLFYAIARHHLGMRAISDSDLLILGMTLHTHTKLKLIFLVEWTIYILFLWTSGGLVSGQVILGALVPLLFFYLAASILTWLHIKNALIPKNRQLLLLSCGLIITDQLLKWLVFLYIPVETSLPVLENWLHVTHERNMRGSWFLTVIESEWAGTGVLISAAVLVLLLALFCYRFYTITYRHTIWVDTAFIGIFAGLGSWLCDMVGRGYVLDYIHVPGVVAADMKDILLTIGVAAFFAEVVDNPDVSWRWKGWRHEYEELCDLARNLQRFIRDELGSLKDKWTGTVRKKPPY